MRIVDRLTEKQVRYAKPDRGKFVKRLLDGNGLYLQATLSKTGGVNRNWVFRYELDGQRRDMGLGSLHDVGLAAAREKAKELREQIVLDGIDPLEARKEETAERRAKAQAARTEKAKAQTFAQCVEKYLTVHSAKWKNAKHAAQWRATLETYAYPVIGRRSGRASRARSPRRRSRTPSPTRSRPPIGAAICSRRAASSWSNGRG